MDKLSFSQVGVGFAFFLIALQTVALLATVVNIRRQAKREDDFATKAEIQRVDGKVETLRGDIVKNGETRRVAIEGKVEEARAEARESASRLDGKINEVREDVAGIKAQTTMIHQSLQLMSAGMGRFGK